MKNIMHYDYNPPTVDEIKGLRNVTVFWLVAYDFAIILKFMHLL